MGFSSRLGLRAQVAYEYSTHITRKGTRTSTSTVPVVAVPFILYLVRFCSSKSSKKDASASAPAHSD